MLHLVLGLSTLLIGSATAQCSRETLQQAADSYIAGVKSGSFAAEGTYSENFKSTGIKAGIHAKPVKIGLSRNLIDTTACATYTELIAPENSTPMVIGTQIRYTGGKISKIETLFNTKENGWVADPKVTFQHASKEKRDIIPEGKRDTRAVIQSIADIYLDKFSNSSKVIPHTTPCERLEGKMRFYPDCTAGIPAGNMKMTNRRYVIDEAFGTVSVFLNFGGGMPDSHEFRVEGGKLRYVHAITVAKGGQSGKGAKST